VCKPDRAAGAVIHPVNQSVFWKLSLLKNQEVKDIWLKKQQSKTTKSASALLS
jgi:hypothetical protein